MIKILLFLLLIVSNNCEAQKVTALPADSSPTADDLMMTVDDVSGTPTSKKVLLSDLKTLMNSGSSGSQWITTTGVGIGTYSNVGIGTINATSLLLVTSTANNDLFKVEDNGPNDTSPFVISKDGYVGIGTTNPTSDFHTFNFSDGAITSVALGSSLNWIFSVDKDNDQTNEINYIQFRRNNSTTDNWTIGQNGANGGNLNISNAGNDFGGTRYLVIQTGTGNIGIGENNANPAASLDLSTTDNQDILIVEDNGDGDPSPFIIKADGAVGIGTTIPPDKVYVVGTVNATTGYKVGNISGITSGTCSHWTLGLCDTP